MTIAQDVNRSWSDFTTDPDGVVRQTGSHSLVIDRTNSPNFRQLVRLGQFLPPLSYSLSKVDELYGLYGYTWWEWVQPGNRATYQLRAKPNRLIYQMRYGTYKTDPFLSLTSSGSIESEEVSISKAVQRFYSNAKELKSSIGVTVAEAPRTFRLVADTATRIARAFKHLRRGQVGQAFNSLNYTNRPLERRLRSQYVTGMRSARGSLQKRDFAFNFASQAWLEAQYGWRPLLGEVFNACEDLASRFIAEPADISIRGGYSFKNNYSWSANMAGGWEARGWPKGFTLVVPGDSNKFERRVGYVVYVKVINDSLRLRKNLGMTNPAEIAWELTPWSFVVDWFVPIGDYLQALTATQGVQFLRGSRSILFKKYVGFTISGTGPTSVSTGQFKTTLGSPVTYSRKEIQFKRTVLSGYPNPGQILRFKPLDEAFSINRTLSSLALLAQAFKR